MRHEIMYPIKNLIAKLAMDAINIQLILDEDHEIQEREFEELVSQAPGIIKDALLPLKPTKYQVRKFELTTRILLSIRREIEFEVRAVPLNLGYDHRYGSTATSESMITFQVEQVPIPKAPVP
ncbi:hypothetical protein ACFL9T_05220 [Thermodesulfobacteriota bacterium]